MELKWVKAEKEQKAKEGSNRTLMELKYHTNWRNHGNDIVF